jgi:hypothetical protein
MCFERNEKFIYRKYGTVETPPYTRQVLKLKKQLVLLSLDGTRYRHITCLDSLSRLLIYYKKNLSNRGNQAHV